jgi:hypothetical protein
MQHQAGEGDEQSGERFVGPVISRELPLGEAAAADGARAYLAAREVIGVLHKRGPSEGSNRNEACDEEDIKSDRRTLLVGQSVRRLAPRKAAVIERDSRAHAARHG